MERQSSSSKQLVEALESLRAEVASLGDRVAALEASGSASPAEASLIAEEQNQELILVISAAVAAFLGKKPHIRQIRLVGGSSWAQQGRATIQASHVLNVHR